MNFQMVDNDNDVVWMSCLERDCSAKIFQTEKLAKEYIIKELEAGAYLGVTDGKWVDGDDGMWYIDGVGWYNPMEVYQSVEQVV